MGIGTDRMARLLEDPRAYPHQPQTVRIVQTHISLVAITPPWVYKIKKPLDLGFLDFSTLASRRHFCEEEVRLNRRLSSGVYLGVVSVSEQDGELRVEDGRHPIEVAVKMRCLGEEGFLDYKLERSKMTLHEIDRVVNALVDFYTSQRPVAHVTEWGRPEKIAISTRENAEQIAPFVGELLSPVMMERIERYTDGFLRRERRLFEERCATGRILDCHGDLRLEHIHLMGHDLQIIDCIEFNERFRFIDVANDVAFLSMDLDHHGRPDLARHLEESVAQAMDDADLPRMADFYKCYRACVRGKVQAMKSREAEVGERVQTQGAERARSFFRRATSYATAGSDPMVIVVMGRVGTGKSTLAHLLADSLGWPVYSSDRLRKSMAGIAPEGRASETERRTLYTRERTRQTYARLCAHASERAQAGKSTILDATYGRGEHRDALRARLGRTTAVLAFIELTAPDEVLIDRLARREGEPGQPSDARRQDFAYIDSLYEKPLVGRETFHATVSTSERSEEDTLRAIFEAIDALTAGRPG